MSCMEEEDAVNSLLDCLTDDRDDLAESECPNCHNGTMSKEEGELRCRGECGSIFSPSQWPAPTEPEPSMEQLQEWVFDSICEATDGCGNIELDGECPHGFPSWVMYYGLI